MVRGGPAGFCQPADTSHGLRPNFPGDRPSRDPRNAAARKARRVESTFARTLMALSVQTILERNRLFRGLSATTVQQVSALAVRRFYEEGALVFSQGDPGDALYGVVTGRIRISASTREGKEMFLNIMER